MYKRYCFIFSEEAGDFVSLNLMEFNHVNLGIENFYLKKVKLPTLALREGQMVVTV